ncbi:hypothetical protein [Actinophytocola sediminis]
MQQTRGLLPAAAVLAGALLSLVGWSWDIQWHSDVGPDTFFTAPHLFLYTGSALCGITALTVVLRTTAAQRAGRPIEPAVGGRSVGVFGGTFTAPVAYLVTGSAAATFLLYGLWDQWWHGRYGFDAMLDSPPHIGLLFGNVTTMLGALMTFAAVRHERWGRIGVFVSLAMMVAFIPVLSDAVQRVSGAIDLVTVCVAGLTVSLLLTAMALFRRPGAALMVAVTVVVGQAALWLFTPWATETYASAVGLPMRDFLFPHPIMPSWIPTGVVVVALLLEGARVLARSRRWSARVVAPVWGAVASAILAVLIPLQQLMLYRDLIPAGEDNGQQVLFTCLLAAVLGALGGVAGWRLGLLLRVLDRPTTTVTEPRTTTLGATA